MAGNRAVTALVARDPKPKTPPPKAPANKQDPPKHNYVAIEGMDPIFFESAHFGQAQRPTTRGQERKAEPTTAPAEVNITTLLGDHSSELFRQSLQGKPFSAEVVFVKPDGQVYLRVKLKNAMISSYSVSGHGGGPDSKPMESWTLNAEKIDVETLADTAPNKG
jgi:type VI protein secretion system component Hcp